MSRAALTRPTALRRISTIRRAIVGTAWALGWTLVWASALMVFATKTRAEPLSPAEAVSVPVHVVQARR